jgi:hypothetical protein
MTLHWQNLWITSGGGLPFGFTVSHKAMMPWSCLVGLVGDLYRVGGNTRVITPKIGQSGPIIRDITSVSSSELTNLLSFMLVQILLPKLPATPPSLPLMTFPHVPQPSMASNTHFLCRRGHILPKSVAGWHVPVLYADFQLSSVWRNWDLGFKVMGSLLG